MKAKRGKGYHSEATMRLLKQAALPDAFRGFLLG